MEPSLDSLLTPVGDADFAAMSGPRARKVLASRAGSDRWAIGGGAAIGCLTLLFLVMAVILISQTPEETSNGPLFAFQLIHFFLFLITAFLGFGA